MRARVVSSLVLLLLALGLTLPIASAASRRFFAVAAPALLVVVLTTPCVS